MMWLSPSSLRDSVYSDHLVDFWKSKGFSKVEPTDIEKNLMDLGNQYEKEVIDKLKLRFNVVSITSGKHIDYGEEFQDYCSLTADAIMSGEEIIASAPLYCPFSELPSIFNPIKKYDGGIYGTSDLLIREDIFKKIHKDPEDCEWHTHHNGSKWRYYIIDIKFSSIKLNKDKNKMLSNVKTTYYTLQVWLYSLMLKYMSGYMSNMGYILGKNEMIAPIDFDEGVYESPIKDAIEWKIELREHGNEWSTDPPSNKWLYPNIKSNTNLSYLRKKKELSAKLRDLTELWYVTPLKRKRAHDEGIKEYTDKRLKANTMGINGRTGEILDDIIEVNRQCGKSVLPKVCKHDSKLWDLDPKTTLYVDFETVGIPIKLNEPARICLIGVYNFTGYTYFLMNGWKDEDERKIIIDFYRIARDKVLVHYGSHEPTMWNQRVKELCLGNLELKWKDMFTFIKNIPFVMKGCLNFSLKSIMRCMMKEGYIKKRESECENGEEAMMKLIKYYTKNGENDINIDTVIKYNKIDCVVMKDILHSLLRK